MEYYNVHCVECGFRTTADNMAINIDNMVKRYCELKGTFGDNSWMKEIGDMYEGVHIGMYCCQRDLAGIGNIIGGAFELTCRDIIRFLERQHNIEILEDNSDLEKTIDEENEEDFLSTQLYLSDNKVPNRIIQVLAENLNIASREMNKRMESVEKYLKKLIEHKWDTVLRCNLEWMRNKDDQRNEFISGCTVTYLGLGGSENTESYQMVCSQCGKELGSNAGFYKEHIVIMLGSARVGKTAYLAALVDNLARTGLMGINVIPSKDKGMEKFNDKIMDQYRRGVKLDKTDEFNMGTIALFTLLFKVGNEHLLIKFVDMPGEAWDGNDSFLLNHRKICKYASAFWMCIDPVQVNNSLACLETSGDGENEQEDDSVNEDLTSVIANILNKLQKILNREKLEQIPLAMILTKSDKVDHGEDMPESNRLSRPELSLEKIGEKTRLEDMLLCGTNIKKQRFKNFENLTRNYINKHINLEQSFDLFKKKNYFAVAAAGRKLEKVNPNNEPCFPSLIELPFLWLLANFGYIGVVKDEIITSENNSKGFIDIFTRKQEPRKQEPIMGEVKCDINELYI